MGAKVLNGTIYANKGSLFLVNGSLKMFSSRDQTFPES